MGERVLLRAESEARDFLPLFSLAYVCMCVRMNKYVYMCIHVHTFTYTYVYTYLYICTYPYAYTDAGTHIDTSKNAQVLHENVCA